MFAVVPTIEYGHNSAKVTIPERFRLFPLTEVDIFDSNLRNEWFVEQNGQKKSVRITIGSVYVPEQKSQRMYTIIYLDEEFNDHFVVRWTNADCKQPMILPFARPPPVEKGLPSYDCLSKEQFISRVDNCHDAKTIVAKYNALMNDILQSLGYNDGLIYTAGEKFPFHREMYDFAIMRWPRLNQYPWLRDWSSALTELIHPDGELTDFSFQTYTNNWYGLNMSDLTKTLAYLRTVG